MEEALWGRKAEKSNPTLWKPPLQDRNLATLEFLGSWYAIRRSLQKNKSSLPGMPRRVVVRLGTPYSAKWTRPVGAASPTIPSSLLCRFRFFTILENSC